MFGWLKQIFGLGKNGPHRRKPDYANRFDLQELARRAGLPLDALQQVAIGYRVVQIPKRSGGTRQLDVPQEGLKQVQRALLYRVFNKLAAHPAAYGFERGRSIADHARLHVGRAIVMRFDIRNFFHSTTAGRVEQYFRNIGWTAEAASLLTQLCTWNGALPQGAPTSPRLSNLVNRQLDTRLTSAAGLSDAVYSRYADDITFSVQDDAPGLVGALISATLAACTDLGYRLNRRKTRVMRRHQRQEVTGLVVNQRMQLPRETRRRLRAIEHQQRTRGEATLNESQIAGWRALQAMIERG